MLVFYLFLSSFFLFFFFYPWSPTLEASQGGFEGRGGDEAVESEEFLWVCESPGGAGEQPGKAGAAGLPGELCLATGMATDSGNISFTLCKCNSCKAVL